MGRWSWVALGLGAYVAFTLAMFPAGTALRWFGPPGIAFAGVSGTLWNGSAASGSVDGFNVQAARWRVNPAALFLGRISTSVEARIPDGFVAGNVSASPSRIELRNFRGATSIPALAGLLPVRGVRGQASATLDRLVLENGWPATAAGEIRVAALETLPLIPNGSGAYLPLGDYTVTFTEAPEGMLAAQVLDNGGPLELAGTVTLDASRSYTIDALVKPRAGAPEQLVQGLNIMTSEPDAEGRRRLNLSGSL